MKDFQLRNDTKLFFHHDGPLANGFLSAQYGKDSVFDGTYDYRSMMPQFTSEVFGGTEIKEKGKV